MDSPQIGQVLASRYRVEQRIGVGAMGAVYRAVHVKIARTFAIKVLHPHLLADDKLRRRFDREAELAATLRHPNVIGVVDVSETSDGLHYIVMDYAHGVPLSHLIAKGPMPGPRAAQLLRKLCDGLHHAHEAGLIHRDFKPDNVMVESDRAGIETPRIVDFGIALLRDESPENCERLTTGGVILGTPQYMPPEHSTGEPIDHRIDLFALGVIAYELLTGKLPFDGTGVDVARANLHHDAPPMRVRVPGIEVDPLLEALTLRLMARKRDLRPPTARAARNLLDLIDRDRDAAARVLGVQLPVEPVAPVVSVASPPTTIAPDGSVAAGPPPAPRSMDTYRVRPMERASSRYLIAGAVAALVLVIALAAIRGGSTPPGTTHEPVIAMAAIAVPAIAPPMVTPIPAPPVATSSPKIVSRIEPPRETPAPTPARSRLATKAPATLPTHPRLPIATPPATETPRPTLANPSPAAVADQYTSVGRALGQLEKMRGQEATLDLWPRFRLIRINAVLADSRQRREVHDTLAALYRDIVDRSR